MREQGLPLHLGRSLLALGAQSQDPVQSELLHEALAVLEPLGPYGDAEHVRQALAPA